MGRPRPSIWGCVWHTATGQGTLCQTATLPVAQTHTAMAPVLRGTDGQGSEYANPTALWTSELGVAGASKSEWYGKGVDYWTAVDATGARGASAAQGPRF